MVHKHFVLSEKSLEIIKRTMETEHIKTETQALEYILQRFGLRETKTAELERILRETYKTKLESIIATARAAERNTEILLEIMNTILTERRTSFLYPIRTHKSSVIEEAEEELKKRLAHQKQIKDYKQGKEGF